MSIYKLKTLKLCVLFLCLTIKLTVCIKLYIDKTQIMSDKL